MKISIHDNGGWLVTFHDVNLVEAHQIIDTLNDRHYYWYMYRKGDSFYCSLGHLGCIDCDPEHQTIDIVVIEEQWNEEWQRLMREPKTHS